MRAFLLVIAVVAIGGGAYWLWGPTAEETPAQNQDTTVTPNPATTSTDEVVAEESDAEVITDSTELEALFASGGNVRCDYESTVEGTVHSGTIYHNANNDGYRISSVSTVDGDTFETDMIMRDQTLYTWGTSPMGEIAYEMELPEDSGPTEFLEGNMEMTPAPDDAASESESVRYECAATDVDPELFELPSGVEFTTMGGMMPAGAM